MSNTQDNSQPDPSVGDGEESEHSSRSEIYVPIVWDTDEDQDLANRIRKAVRAAAKTRGFENGELGVRVCSDPEIHRLNIQHLGHDYPTDVISFSYGADNGVVEGELVVSIDTATRAAAEIGWPPECELILYVVHGSLHITGMTDDTPESAGEMRRFERRTMLELGYEDIVQFGADRHFGERPGMNPRDESTVRGDRGHDQEVAP